MSCFTGSVHTAAPGVYTLTVPTGGGKTTAAMAFALTAAVQNCMSRVIYAAPYTSIIDQNADTFEKIFGTENVIEHHSSAEYLFSESPNPAEYRKMLAAENWDAPVIATTTVQLFESLFASKPARCRKLHNLANSVLILDEVQTLPMPYLKPFTAALAELARKYGVIVVLCTATQPALDGVFADLKIDLPIKEICPDVPENFETQIASSSWTPSGRKLGLPQPLRLRKQCQGMLQRVLLECSTPDSSSEGC